MLDVVHCGTALEPRQRVVREPSARDERRLVLRGALGLFLLLGLCAVAFVLVGQLVWS